MLYNCKIGNEFEKNYSVAELLTVSHLFYFIFIRPKMV
jgi:hypothetical protein